MVAMGWRRLLRLDVGLSMAAGAAGIASVCSLEGRDQRSPPPRPMMFVRDPDAFARKWKKFSTDGMDKLLVIADFDYTLTPCFKPTGERAVGTHGILVLHKDLDPEVKRIGNEMFLHYYPLEQSSTLSNAEKLPLMVEWWTKEHDLLIAHNVTKQLVKDAVLASDISFRDGFHDIFALLAGQNVPTLIFSAGLYDVIHAILDSEYSRTLAQSPPANIHVISNMMRFDDQGKLVDFDGKLIHSMNKNASVLIDTAFWRQCQMEKRHNILLLGDSLGDANMANGLEFQDDEIMRIGFLNDHVEENLEKYLQRFDVVLTHDSSLRPFMILLTWSCNKKITSAEDEEEEIMNVSVGDLQTFEKEAQVLRATVEGNHVNEAKSMLAKLKIALTKLPSLPPCGADSATAVHERSIARHVLESATMLSILSEDMASFERSVIQLRAYYNNPGLQPSPLHYPILGTRLLQLLVENRMAEFHNELELIPEQSREDPNIAFGIKLEQYLMEGSYNKVLEARTNVPNPFFKFFLSQLLQTVRENIADCAEIAYQCLELSDAQKMLIFDSVEELSAYIQERKPEWVVRDTQVWFKAPEKSLGASDIPSLRLVGETLSYATELDRIV